MMREIVRNCRLCQESMDNSPFMLCQTCLKESEQVWNFIKKNPYVSIKDIAVATEVSFVKVERMINYGKERQQRVIKRQ
ncbi:hypothetical protein [Oceanobacillus alkalisoli]|uniref:hypothetical protein n=1 Tax=Oceanobacillus alkalisoli TaxID=2925113 RepID=UPI001EE493B9|nr:hypothetical protein [Oceanobacillus alkalisoli]MCG5102048.1 hypothetical protein [Oceanobacillus alkalisoli]